MAVLYLVFQDRDKLLSSTPSSLLFNSKKIDFNWSLNISMPYNLRPSTRIKSSFSNRGIPVVKVIPEPNYSKFDYSVIDSNGRVSLIEWKANQNASNQVSLSS